MAKVNSKAKGKRGELALSNYLKSLGFEARRGQQFRGGGGSPDVVCESLPNLHLESKFGYPKSALDIGSSLLTKACEQAERECGGKRWAVLWKPLGCRDWRMTTNATVHDTCLATREALIAFNDRTD